MEPIGEKAPLATRPLLRLPGGEGRPAPCAGPGEAACWPPGLARVSGTTLADEESERDSVHTGESHEGAEELHVELAQLSTEQLLALVEENRCGRRGRSLCSRASGDSRPARAAGGWC